MADIMGVIGWSLDSPEAAASESFESLFELELLFEFPLLFALLFELLFEFELLFPPPTRFCMKSCNLPHLTGITGNKLATRHREQAIIVTNFIGLILRCACLFLIVGFKFFDEGAGSILMAETVNILVLGIVI